MTLRKHSFSKNRPGAILVAVMGLIFLMALVVTQIMDAMTLEFKRLNQAVDRDELRFEAQSLLELSQGVLYEIQARDKRLTSTAQGWGNPVAFAQLPEHEMVKKSITVEDLSGRIPLHAKTSPKLIEALFNELGFQLSESSLLTDSLLDWVDPDDDSRLNGAERDYYEHLRPPYAPANGPLSSYNDLKFIMGFNTLFYDSEGVKLPVFNKFKDDTTLYGTNPVNLNSAPPEVLKIFCNCLGVDYNVAENILKGPDGVRGTVDDGVLDAKNFKPTNPEGLPKNAYGFETKLVKIEIRLTRGENTFLLTALVQPGKSANQSSTLLVRENRTLE